MDSSDARATHDIGGVSAFMCLPVDTGTHELSAFDREVDALLQILRARGLIGVDELRRAIEALPEAEYFALGYYQRWLRAIVATLLRKGTVTEQELAAALGQP